MVALARPRLDTPWPILAVDPGAASGVALLMPVEAGQMVRYRLERFGLLRPTTTLGVADVLDELVRHAGGQVRLYVEDQYIRVDGGLSSLAVKRLIIHRAQWQTLAQLRGYQTIPVLASTWQPRVLSVRGKAERSKLKQAAQALVQGVFGVKPTQDEADAVCIACWAITQEEANCGRPCRALRGAAPGMGERWH